MIEEDAANLFGEQRADLLRQGSLFYAAEANRENYYRALDLIERSRVLAAEQHFLHWQAAFPGVWDNWTSDPSPGGFDVVVGNPPWDRIKLQEVEWFAARRPQIAHATTAAERKRLVSDLMASGGGLAEDYEVAKEAAETAARIVRANGQYPLLSRGDINIYALFVERAARLVNARGIVSLLVPSGIASDKNYAEFFQSHIEKQTLMLFLDFFNKKYDGSLFFPDVYYRFKFSVFAFGGSERHFPAVSYGCFLRDLKELESPARVFQLSAADIRTVNPNTGTAPIFRTARDAEITTALYRRSSVLLDRRHEPFISMWPVDYIRMFDMTNDSRLFHTRTGLEAMGGYAVANNRLKKGSVTYLPLYEGKMVQAFDHRAAGVTVDAGRRHRPGQPLPTTLDEHSDPGWQPEPQFWVVAAEVSWPEGLEWALALKDVTSTTNTRTVIASMLPVCAAGNTLPLIWPRLPAVPTPDADDAIAAEWRSQCLDAMVAYREWAPLLLANLNSLPLDYVARQKVQGQHLNWYIVEQLPVVSEVQFRDLIGQRPIGDLVRDEVVHLTYVAHDMAPFARDQGYSGPPFAWDEEDRLRRRARLDALFFLLYGLDSDETGYVLDQFPIVRRQEEAAFGRYRSKGLILGYLAAFRSNDPDAVIAA